MNPNTLVKTTMNPPFTPYVSKHDAGTGMIQWMAKYGEIGLDN